jgi:hypothetical protein
LSNELQREELLVWYETPEELVEAWARDLVMGALFVPTPRTSEPGTRVRVVIELPFCEGSIDMTGEIVGAVSDDMETAGGVPGLSVQTDMPIPEIRDRIEALTGVALPDGPSESVDPRRIAPRFDAEAPVAIEADGRTYKLKTIDVSYNGLLALLPGIDIGEGTEVRVKLTHPQNGQTLDVEGQVARQTLCSGGIMAVGVRFNYGFGRVDEVTAFIDDLRGYGHARELTKIHGSLRDTPLEDVMETFSAVASCGTLLLTRGEEQGKIAYYDGEIVCAMTGLVSGTKALGRMFSWIDADFEFQPEVDLTDLNTPVPLDSAIIAAAFERDELLRLDVDRMMAAEGFEVDKARLGELVAGLSPVEKEVAENAGMGFPPVALLDIVSASDAQIHRALAELIDVGVLRLI